MNVLNDSIIEQTAILLSNIEMTIREIDEKQLYDIKICDWPLGEQVFHLLQSLDKWFINPNNYKVPEIIHRKTSTTTFSKQELIDFFNSVKTKVLDHIGQLGIDELETKPSGCQFNRLTLILGQYRHVMYHVGQIHGCLRAHTGGTTPEYIGLKLE